MVREDQGRDLGLAAGEWGEAAAGLDQALGAEAREPVAWAAVSGRPALVAALDLAEAVEVLALAEVLEPLEVVVVSAEAQVRAVGAGATAELEQVLVEAEDLAVGVV